MDGKTDIQTRSKNVAIVGMGYVGLTLAVMMAKKGFKVHGIETNRSVADNLKLGIPQFKEKGLAHCLKREQRNGSLAISEKLPDAQIDAYIISVGTPLNHETKEPNIDFIDESVNDVAHHIRKGALVVLRSTVPTGLSRSSVIPRLEKVSGLVAGQDFSFVFAPERTIEGNALAELETNSQIIGGLDERSVTIAADLFRSLTPTIVTVSSIEAAEMIKIIDNSYRDVRFAYANEIAMMCERLNLDATELITAANCHYPRNNIPVPSPGVGGACLSKDPHILCYLAKKHDYEARLIADSRAINEAIPGQIVHRIRRRLAKLNKNISDAKIFIVGFAFKGQPETSDLRDSTTLHLLEEMSKHSTNIFGFDPVIDDEVIARLGVTTVGFEEGCRDADVVMFMNNHSSYLEIDAERIASNMHSPGIFYDAWRMFSPEEFERSDVSYMGVGR